MSPLIPGRARVKAVSAQDLTAAADALGEAVRSGGAELPPEQSARAGAVVDKVRRRLGLTGGHTVVALAGATGSGKSSIFNALVGSAVATVGARRPTTSTPTAAIWGDEPVADLLDWVGVTTRHHVHEAPGGATAGHLDGLVLLDLPDFDSRETTHRQEAERILDLADVFVWVTDPQKYADARLHDDYVAALASHDTVMLVVLNQIDRLTPLEAEQCVADLRRLLARDGVADTAVLPVSAQTGAGIDTLRQRLVNTVTGQNAARQRLAADVRTEAQRLSGSVGEGEPRVEAEAEGELVDALARSAGVATVVDAVARDYRMEATSHTGWPFTRWVQAFRPKPLRRLRLDDTAIEVSEQDMRSVLGRSSIPPPSPAARAAVSLATRGVVGRAADGLPTPWADAVQAAAGSDGADLTDALDQAVVATPLRTRNPLWWRLVGTLQVLLALSAVGGLLWYAALWVLGALAFPVPEPPLLGQVVPLPFALLVGGLVLGLVVAALSRAAAGVGARRRARTVEKRLRSAIADVADAQILAPVAAVLQRHADTRAALARARSV